MVLSGLRSGIDLGSWSTAYPHVYAVDFTSLTTLGTYTILGRRSVRGFLSELPDRRRAEPLRRRPHQLADLLPDPARRADFIPSALRTAAAHLHDQTAMTYLTPSTTPARGASGAT